MLVQSYCGFDSARIESPLPDRTSAVTKEPRHALVTLSAIALTLRGLAARLVIQYALRHKMI